MITKTTTKEEYFKQKLEELKKQFIKK